MKTIISSLLLLSLGITLTACNLPIVDREFTVPIFEKEESEVMNASLNKLAELKNYSLDSTFKADIKTDDNNLTFLNNKVIDKIIELLSKSSPQVVESNKSNGMASNANTSLTKQSKNITITYTVKGDVFESPTDQQSSSRFNFLIEADMNGIIYKAEIDTITVTNNIYFNILTLPEALQPSLLDMGIDANGGWWKINSDEINKSDVSNEVQSSSGGEKKAAIKNETLIIFTENPILKFQKRLKDEIINNEDHYHYDYNLDKDNIKKNILAISNVYEKEFTGTNAGQDFLNDTVSKSLDSFISAIKTGQTEVWVNKKTLEPKRFQWQINMAIPQENTNGAAIVNGSIDLSGTIEYSALINDPLIKAPESFRSVMETMNKNAGKKIEASQEKLSEPSSLEDSDNDGLSDKEESTIYHSDPLRPDTDGDSYKDGDEVKGGYNPNGEGRL